MCYTIYDDDNRENDAQYIYFLMMRIYDIIDKCTNIDVLDFFSK